LRGVSDPHEPAIAVRDLPARSRRGSTSTQFLEQLVPERIHRAEALELYAIDRALVSALVARLERRVAFSLSITDHELYLSIEADNLTGTIVRLNRVV
jgi:uncharacterized protein YaeQ